MHRLNNHSQECRNLMPAQREQTFIDFILPRTKYPVTAQQIRTFINIRKKSNLPCDARSIVDALADFGKFEMTFCST